MLVSNLKLTQDGFRHSADEIAEMIEFVRHGGRFDLETLKRHDPNKEPLLIAITDFDDGTQYVRDGFHRVMAIQLGRPGRMMYEDEFFEEHLTYLRMMTPRMDLRYYTPFDPRVEVRASDFGDFRLQCDQVLEKGEEDIMEFIKRNHDVYARPRLPHHETVESFAKHWCQQQG